MSDLSGQDPTSRMKALSNAASDVKIDSRIPVRRYFRSGQEMIKMAEVYRTEGNLEASYVLYMKYMTLFVEKLKNHKDYAQILPAEKKKVRSSVKEAMAITENLKPKLIDKFTEEYDAWLLEEKLKQEERQRAEEEERRRRAEIDAGIERDRQVAMWHQAQFDQEERSRRGLVDVDINQGPQVSNLHQYDPNKYSQSPSAPPPSYHEVTSDLNNLYSFPGGSGGGSSTPQFDRNTKPVPAPSPSSVITAATLPSSPSPSPSVPSRALKPATTTEGLRTVAVPGDLIVKFLGIAKVNSDRGIETLGTLGGQLRNNKFMISHLLIPRQVGKSDSCTMDGLEDVWDIHDKENIIFLGWIHTHPAYSVFLSSVDMHNQYEWQHMLPEAIATVCSIKDNEVGHLRLTDSGMSEIGDCTLTNFHPHSKQPPLFEEASHVIVDTETKVVVRDLR